MHTLPGPTGVRRGPEMRELNVMTRTGLAPRKLVEEDRAAVLLGVTREQLQQLCKISGLGRELPELGSKNRVFTYQELYRLCRLVVHPPARYS